MERREGVRQQYEAWPYPHYPFLAAVRRLDTWQLNLDYLFDRCGFGPPPARRRIWIAGCGTFQPYTFGLANPDAHICASDNSLRSLRLARRRCAWHGLSNIEFAKVDLNDERTWPAGPFEYIECYGVLMNLEDPQRTLRAMADRLSEGGVIRIMVYPHYSRQRIFQVQRIAQLLGLHFGDPQHPGLLRRVMTSLPKRHPLRHAFEAYPDSANNAGIVDGFLHAGDRGFTGLELGALMQAAELAPAFWFHRPWGQPDRMAKELGLKHLHPAAMLDYLDRWQELRSNLIVCMRRHRAAQQPEEIPLRLHPHLDPARPNIPWIARARIWLQRFTGLRLPTRTHTDCLRWSPRDLAILARAARGEAMRPTHQPIVARGQADGLLLGGAPSRAPALDPRQLPPVPDPAPRLFVGERIPNPLYHHLFAAWRQDGPQERWRDHADPLEEPGQFGLTPYGTWVERRDKIEGHLRRVIASPVASFDELEYDQEPAGRQRLCEFLRRFPDLPEPEQPRTSAEERELWILLGSHDELFLDATRRFPGSKTAPAGAAPRPCPSVAAPGDARSSVPSAACSGETT